jgi:hypothetical protein
MSKRLLFSVAASLAITVALWAQASSAILGRWQAEKHGVPWLIVNVSEERSKLGGSAVFYVLDGAESATPTVLGKQEVRLIDAKLVGNVFSFKVRNQQADVTMNPSSGELLNFEMTLKDETHATLKSISSGDQLMVKKE